MRIKLGVPMSLNEITFGCGGRLIGHKNPLISYLTTDSREVAEGDLFVAIKGVRYDGESYVNEVKNKGGYVISSSEGCDVLCSDTITALLSLAEYYVKKLPYVLYKIGITGSVGKTTTKEFLKILLSKKHVTHASKDNFNNEIGLPISILSAPPNSEILLMEMGMNHSGEISRLSKCLRPNIALITNIGTAHIGNLGNRENIAKSKLEITDWMENGYIFVPKSEPLLHGLNNSICFSMTDKNADYYLESLEEKEVRIYKSGEPICQSFFALNGDHNKSCLLAATSISDFIGISDKQLGDGISFISRINTRQTLIKREGYCFYTDFYNASLESTLACINTAENEYKQQKKSLLLGDILELGEMTKKIHIAIGEAISSDTFSHLFLFGGNAQHIAIGAMKNLFPIERIHINVNLSDPYKTAQQIRLNCIRNEIIFMKASRGVMLERVLGCFH